MFDEVKQNQSESSAPVDMFADTDKDRHAPSATTQPQSVPQPLPKDTKFEEHLSHSFITKKTIIISASVVGVLVVAGFAAQMFFFTKGTPEQVPIIDENSGTQTTEGVIPADTAVESPEAPPIAPIKALDTDGDGLSDDEERGLGTDSSLVDTDGDLLADSEEVRRYHSDPLKADTDADGFSDGQEVQNGYNPLGSGKLLEAPPVQDLSASESEPASEPTSAPETPNP